MLIINVRDNENNRWKRKGKKTNKDRKQQMGDTSYGESVRGKWLCCTFKLGFLQLICKASLIFKSNLELALSFILKERKFYKPKHVCCHGVQMFKNMRLLSFLIFLNPSFKMKTSFANVAITTVSTRNLYTTKNFKSSGMRSLYEKQFLILNELKTNLM